MINKYTGHYNIYSSFGLLLLINTLNYTSVRLYNTGRSHVKYGQRVTSSLRYTVQKSQSDLLLKSIKNCLLKKNVVKLNEIESIFIVLKYQQVIEISGRLTSQYLL